MESFQVFRPIINLYSNAYFRERADVQNAIIIHNFNESIASVETDRWNLKLQLIQNRHHKSFDKYLRQKQAPIYVCENYVVNRQPSKKVTSHTAQVFSSEVTHLGHEAPNSLHLLIRFHSLEPLCCDRFSHSTKLSGVNEETQ